MSVTILEALMNAEINLGNGPVGIMLAKAQIHNAIVLLEKGYDLYDEVEPLLGEYGNVDAVPKAERR